jgi:hypothetical protein
VRLRGADHVPRRPPHAHDEKGHTEHYGGGDQATNVGIASLRRVLQLPTATLPPVPIENLVLIVAIELTRLC